MHNVTLSSLLEHKSPVIHSVNCTTTIAEAVREMNRHKIGSVIVMDGGTLAGIFTERDVLTRVVGADLDAKTTPVSQVMTQGVMTVSPATTVEEVMKLFQEKRCRHLPVVKEGRVAGVISIGDISRFVAGVHAMECEQLKQYIAGGYPT